MKTLRHGTCDQCGRNGDVIAKYLPSSGNWCDQCNKKRLEDGKGMVKKAAVKSPPKGVIPKLVKELDRVFSIFIRKRAILGVFSDWGVSMCWTCWTMKKWDEMDCGHFVPRGNFAVRWDEINCQCQCRNCNRINNGMYEEFEKQLRLGYGDDAVNALLIKKNDTSFKLDRHWLQEKINHYKKLIGE